MFKTLKVEFKSVLRKKRKPIKNQRSLVGVLCRLMEGQKLFVCVIRLMASTGETTIPIGFKLNKDRIPPGIKLMEIHYRNLVQLEIDGCRPLSAMIVASGEDSKDLETSYEMFCAKVERLKAKIAKLERKVTIWLNNEELAVIQVNKKVLSVTTQEEFDNFIGRANKLQRREKSKILPDAMFPTVDSGHVDIEELSQSESEDSDTEKRSTNQQKAESSDKKESGSKKNKPSLSNNPITAVKESLSRLNNLVESAPVGSLSFNFFVETRNILKYLVEYNENHENDVYTFHDDIGDKRFIPEEDSTKELDGKLSLIEGILPLPTRKYLCSLRFREGKSEEEFGPTNVLSNITRFSFPNHWIRGVTVRGSGGRKSLIRIWDHEEPYKNPPAGHYIHGLGERRLRALLDHAVRKSGKKSYDKLLERDLVSTLAKAMHYVRKYNCPSKKSTKKTESRVTEITMDSENQSAPNKDSEQSDGWGVYQEANAFDLMSTSDGEEETNDSGVAKDQSTSTKDSEKGDSTVEKNDRINFKAIQESDESEKSNQTLTTTIEKIDDDIEDKDGDSLTDNGDDDALKSTEIEKERQKEMENGKSDGINGDESIIKEDGNEDEDDEESDDEIKPVPRSKKFTILEADRKLAGGVVEESSGFIDSNDISLTQMIQPNSQSTPKKKNFYGETDHSFSNDSPLSLVSRKPSPASSIIVSPTNSIKDSPAKSRSGSQPRSQKGSPHIINKESPFKKIKGFTVINLVKSPLINQPSCSNINAAKKQKITLKENQIKSNQNPDRSLEKADDNKASNRFEESQTDEEITAEDMKWLLMMKKRKLLQKYRSESQQAKN